jgi:hypothetical protein
MQPSFIPNKTYYFLATLVHNTSRTHTLVSAYEAMLCTVASELEYGRAVPQ